jgi:hypothetical protein
MTDMDSNLTRSHWYWRPGWRIGRSQYAWHIIFSEVQIAALQPLLDHYRLVMQSLPHLEPLPTSGLHLTTQGVGFTDEVPDAELAAIIDRSTLHLGALPPVNAIFGPAQIDAEGIYLPVNPRAALEAIRIGLLAAMADVHGPGHVVDGPGLFAPHVTLGYSDDIVPLAEARAVLEAESPATAEVCLTHVSLIKLDRDNRRYDWSTVATVLLGGTA